MSEKPSPPLIKCLANFSAIKVFVHPECPFSVETFNLLAQFDENSTSDFYMAHKKDFLKYVEEPLKYISSQVEEQLPNFIKKHINIKYESCCVID